MARRAALRHPTCRQYGVIPVRLSGSGQLQVLLLTSRRTGRWVVPRGWPMQQRTPAATAEQEAYEEAGLKGSLWSRRPVGSYRYRKPDHAELGEIEVKLFILGVAKQARHWPECAERRTCWFSIARAASLVEESELARLLMTIPDMVSRRTAA